MKHAYLIIANRNPQQLQWLINAIDDSRNDIFLMIDNKSNIKNCKFTATYSTLIIVESINIYWGDYSLVDAELRLLKSSIKGEYAYYHFLSGLDLPLVNQDKIHDFFDSVPNHEFLTYSAAIDQKLINQRVKRHLFNKHFRPSGSLNRIYRKIEKHILELVPEKDYSSVLGFASNWATIDNDLASILISSEQEISSMFNHGYLVDELFIPSIININSEIKKKVYYSEPVKDSPNEFQGNLRYINWWDGSPYTWRYKDYYQLDQARKMGHLFSRKFDITIDRKIVDKILKDVLN